jgi:cytochrome P450
MGLFPQGGTLDAARFGAGMVIDPLKAMLEAGTATAQARAWVVWKNRPGARKFLYLTGARHVAPVFQDPTTFQTSNVTRRLPGGGAQARLRRGLIGAQGAEHRHYRQAFEEETGPPMRERFAEDVARHAARLLQDVPSDRPVDLVGLLNDMVRYYSVVGMYQDAEIEPALDLGREITRWIDMAYAPGVTLFPFRIPGTPYRRFLDQSDKVEAALLAWTAKRRGQDMHRDLLSRFVNGPDENGLPLPEGRLAGHVTNLYAASFSSSVTSICWTLFLLMQHPDVAQDVCDEIAGIDVVSDSMSVLSCPLLDRVVREGMRLFTPVPYQVRRLSADTELAGIPLRRKDTVVIGTWAHNRLADVWAEPERFRPERWEGRRMGEFDYLTFSAGPRRCVGFFLAQIMVKLTLATILQQRRPRLAPGTRVDTRVAINLRAKGPVPVVMAGREAAFQRVEVAGTVNRVFS